MISSYEEQAYVGLLAVAWDSLERIGERLDGARGLPPASRIDEVRLELILWKDASRYFARRTDLTEANRDRLDLLVSRAAAVLEAGLYGQTEQLRDCIGRAQDCLYDEAHSLLSDGPGDPASDLISVALLPTAQPPTSAG